MDFQEIRCSDCIVKSIPAEKLTSEELNILNSNCARISFKPGENIIKQGAFTTNIVYIKSGLVKEHMRGLNGKEEILKITKAPAYIGVPSAMGGRIHNYSCTALETTSVCFIDIHVFNDLLLINPFFSRELIVSLSRDLLEHFSRCVNKTQKQLHGSLAETILFLSEKIYNSDSFQLSLTRADLGALIGTTRETVTRILHEYTENDFISINGKSLQILNREMLQKISDAG
ncbi:Crp/Fnr family transcriptional regulator [Bacteroidota bacterium]